MAARTFLTETEKDHCLALWSKHDDNLVSQYLQDKVIEKLSALPNFEDLQLFGLGSLARQEMCPKSDIDLLIIGETKSIQNFMEAAHKAALNIRSRTFGDVSEVLEGAEVFDILSMSEIFAFPNLHLEAKIKASKAALQQLIGAKIKRSKRQILKTLNNEKIDRKKRFDSLVNYLEPNLKLGSGGIRDIQQSLYLFSVFPERFVLEEKNRIRLASHKKKLLKLRQGLHLLGFGDALVAQAQLELQKILGFEDISALMTDIEKSFSEAAFYAAWALEKVRRKALVHLPQKPVEIGIAEVRKVLSKDCGELTQEQLRHKTVKISKKNHRVLRQLINHQMDEDLLMALFQSKVMYQIFPDLKKVEGLVQHDQYHLLTVDAHLKQAMRQVLRAFRKPGFLGPRMRSMARKFTKMDWEILFWGALFHDLAKGRRGDHSTVGAKLCKEVLGKLGFESRLIIEVAWIVENHLIFSVAAFRRNPSSPKTMHWLLERGVKGDRVNLLAFFTAIDIFATNPTAWNTWKEKLIDAVATELTSSRALRLEKLLSGLSRTLLRKDLDFYSALDPRLLSELPGKTLRDDLKKMQAGEELKPLILSAGKGKFWVRFHSKKDVHGLFAGYVQALFQSGLSVAEAFAQTMPDYGVYDWFYVRGGRELDATKKLLDMSFKAEGSKKPEPKTSVKFDKVEIIEQEDGTAIVSFRGLDQKGALLAAATALFEAELPVIWAKVNTWGRRIDDVFSIHAESEKLENFREKILPKLIGS